MHLPGHFSPSVCVVKPLLTASGEIKRYLYFVPERLQRIFSVTEEGKEATLIFSYPYSFCGIADSFLLQKPSMYFFETLTASHFLRIHYERLQQLIQQYPSIQQFLTSVTASALQGAMYRQIKLQSYSNEKKFQELMQRNVRLSNIVSHKYLAFYMGMDVTNFSKLLNSQKITNHGKCHQKVVNTKPDTGWIELTVDTNHEQIILHRDAICAQSNISVRAGIKAIV